MGIYPNGGALPNQYGKVHKVLFMLKSETCIVYHNDGREEKVPIKGRKDWEKWEFKAMIEEWYGSGVSIEFYGKQPKKDRWDV